MMLVSSSGWAHSPITLILIGLSIEFAVGGAALPGIATVIAIAAAVSTAPMNRTRKRFIDRTSVPPPENDGNGDLPPPPVFGSHPFARHRTVELRRPYDGPGARVKQGRSPLRNASSSVSRPATVRSSPFQTGALCDRVAVASRTFEQIRTRGRSSPIVPSQQEHDARSAAQRADPRRRPQRTDRRAWSSSRSASTSRR